MLTSTIADLRTMCQRGEMPTYAVAINAMASHLLDVFNRLDGQPFRIWRDHGLPLDALAALQEALWPGSAVVVDLSARPPIRYMVELYHVGDGRLHAFACSAINHNIPLCPTLATAWLDAILAGLQAEADHD